MVEPGAVETELPDHITGEKAKEGIQSIYGLDILQQAEDVADAIASCVIQPEGVSVNGILIRPTQQAN